MQNIHINTMSKSTVISFKYRQDTKVSNKHNGAISYKPEIFESADNDDESYLIINLTG